MTITTPENDIRSCGDNDVTVTNTVTTIDTNTTATTYNVSVPLASTEVSLALPSNCKEFILRSRGREEVKLAYTATESGTKFLTVRGTAVYRDSNFYAAQTIYFQTSVPGAIIEVVAYAKL